MSHNPGCGGFGSLPKSRGSRYDPKMPEVDIIATKRPKRGQYAPNSFGKEVELISNFFKLQTTNLKVYHYDVDIRKSTCEFDTIHEELMDIDDVDVTMGQPTAMAPYEKYIRLMCPKVVSSFMAGVGAKPFQDVPYVYDGHKNLYTANQLGFKNQIFNVQVDKKKFNIKIQEVTNHNVIDLGEVNSYYSANSTSEKISDVVITVYDIIFRHIIGSDPRHISHQRNFYNLNDTKPFDCSSYINLVSGFCTSVRMTEFGLGLNIDLTYGCMLNDTYKQLDQLVNAILKDSGSGSTVSRITSAQLENVNNVVKGFKIFTTHSTNDGQAVNRFYTINKIVLESPFNAKIQDKDGKDKQDTVADYFQNQYGITPMKYSVMVSVVGKNNIKLPLELCRLVSNQFVANSKLDKKMHEACTQGCTTEPNVTFNKLAQIAKNIKSIKPSLLTSFGITLSTNPVKVKGRVLPSPSILNRIDRQSRSHVKYFKKANGHGQINNWALLNFNRNCTRNNLANFVDKIIKRAKNDELIFSPKPHYKNIETVDKVDEELKLLKKKNVELVMVVVPEGPENQRVYRSVKRLVDLKYELPCCCINFSKLIKFTESPRGDKGYLQNFLFKVNSKLGGQNKVADPKYVHPTLMESTIMVGIDVNHPGVMEKMPCSIAAAVGSLDSAHTLYTKQVRVQALERDEIVHDIKKMIFKLLQEYKEANKNKAPSNLIVFRDGVSEGQFAILKEKEVPLIREAIRSFEMVYPASAPAQAHRLTTNATKIKLTVIVVQKRHHTRFALITPSPIGKGHTYNVANGTVVDKLIVAPNCNSFVLNSHFSPKGTSSPSKYTVLVNDAEFSFTQLQQVAYYSCHNAPQTDKVLSIPTCVLTADLCAFRAKIHFDVAKDMTIKNIDDVAAVSSEAAMQSQPTQDKMERLNKMIVLPPKTRKRPYCF